MTIFYFTATGNCLEVTKNIGGKAISIPSVQKGNQFEFEDDTIGIISPVYGGTIPKPVADFIQKVQLRANYIFGILTYGFNKWNASEDLLMIGKENNIMFDYINSIHMVDNSFVYFDMDKQIETLPKKRVGEAIAKIKEEIEVRTHKIYDINTHTRIVGNIFKKVHKTDIAYHEKFFIENTCVKCGICQKVCPIDNITLEDKPIIHDKCIRCGACTHNCPKNAIRYKGEKSKARYRNKNVTLAEIVKSNSSKLE